MSDDPATLEEIRDLLRELVGRKRAERSADKTRKRRVRRTSKEDLDLDLLGNTSSACPADNAHADLIAYFVAAVRTATGVEYKFTNEDGAHVKKLIERFGLDDAKRLVDLAVARHSDPFWAKLGLSLRMIVSDANRLRTAKERGFRAMKDTVDWSAADEVPLHVGPPPGTAIKERG